MLAQFFCAFGYFKVLAFINSKTNRKQSMKDSVIEEIKRQCGKVRVLNNGWCHFVYHHLHYLNIPDDSNGMIRISIPHVVNSKEYKKEEVDAAVNETNREVKFIKAMVLNNGSISLNYDHRISKGENIGEIVEHIITTLYIASEYLVLKLKSK